MSEFESHIARQDNPHQINKVQVGLDKVPNYPIATDEEAIAGIRSDRLITSKQLQLILKNTLINKGILDEHGNIRQPSLKTGTVLWGYKDSPFYSFWGAALDSKGFVYGGDNHGNVFKITSEGEKVWVYDGNKQRSFSIALDHQGSVYSGTSDWHVIKLSPEGEEIWKIRPHERSVYSVAVDKNNFIYSASEDGSIKKYHQMGQ